MIERNMMFIFVNEDGKLIMSWLLKTVFGFTKSLESNLTSQKLKEFLRMSANQDKEQKQPDYSNLSVIGSSSDKKADTSYSEILSDSSRFIEHPENKRLTRREQQQMTMP